MTFTSVLYEDRRFWNEFIELYRNLPILWTKTADDEERKSKHLRDRAFKILLRKYRESQPSATLSMVKNTIKSIQSAYRKELRIALQQERLHAIDSTEYESPLWCFTELNFLRSQEEARLRHDLEKDEENATVINITVEDDLDVYCKNLTEEMRKLSVEQLQYAKNNFSFVLYLASKGLLTRDWPQLGSKPFGKGSDLRTARTPTVPARTVHTVKGTVRFRKQHALTSNHDVQHSKNIPKRALVDEIDELPIEEENAFEHLGTECDEDLSDISVIEEKIILEATEGVKFGTEPIDDETSSLIDHHRPEDTDEDMDKLEITLIGLPDVPEDTHQSLSASLPPTADASNENNLISVRLPTGLAMRRQCRMHSSSYVDNVMENYSDEEFLRQFRMGRNTVQMLSQHLETTNVYKKLKGHGGYEAISAQTHVLAFLWFLGHEKKSYREVAELFELSVSCLHDVIWRVCDAISAMEADVIVRPDDEKKSSSATHFLNLYALPGVIGCVGGTQIKIDKPIENSNRYLLRKGYYSMQLQAITDEHLRFVDIFIEHPGEQDMLAGVKSICGDQFCLLGGDEYSCLPQLLVPYRADDGKQLTRSQELFNESLQKARTSCINVFRQLKQRFRQLKHLKGRQLSRVVKLIKVCCILHNLASQSEMALIDTETNDDREEESYASVSVYTPYNSEDRLASDVARGQQHRDVICESF